MENFRVRKLTVDLLAISSQYLKGVEPQCFLVLCSYAVQESVDGWFRVKLKNLAARCGISRRTVIYTMNALCDIGYIERTREGRSYKYRIRIEELCRITDVTNNNVGVSKKLRELVGDRPISSATKGELEKALEMSDEIVRKFSSNHKIW